MRVVDARCFRLKRARKRWARGADSERRVLRRVRRVGSVVSMVEGAVAEGVIFVVGGLLYEIVG
jgi:hypothetical protein